MDAQTDRYINQRMIIEWTVKQVERGEKDRLMN